ncbi:DNA polymerase III subunit [Butyrivibrio sp. AE3004]|uniref:DNA polymerase III subunit n=1 Tax=Butyrivibrio sp. AE3004 TaxID=1506994 RepID=UPI000493C3C8|nr:DNA polymerase III subunit delta' C-terminal domain-containing protein [Butyrivibrio sp. AE3004]
MAHFLDIIDQDQIKEHMQNALKTGKISHAYIISGDAGSGKKMIAGVFAQTILCEDKKDVDGVIENCGECHSCKQAQSQSHPDIRIVRHEKATSIGVDEIRQQVCDDVYIKPYSDHKIYIIPDGELMTQQAQNALLKTLEEPPAYATILILTSNIDAFLPTILSRCIVFNLKPVRDDLIQKYLMEKRQVVDYKAQLAVSFAQGNVGKAILLSENEDFERLKNGAIDLVSRLGRTQISELIERLQTLLSPKEGSEKKMDVILTNDFLDVLLFFVRDILVYKAENSADHLIFADKLSYISSVTEKCSYKEIDNILMAIERARARIRANVNSLMTLEMLMLDIKENL